MASSTPKTQHSHNNRSSEWTSEMRDKQARGKNPYSEDSDASDTEPMRLGGQYVTVQTSLTRSSTHTDTRLPQ
jgi:hypothetical protein